MAHYVVTPCIRSLPHISPLYNYLTHCNYISDPILTQTLFGQTFENPLGLAAGFDKNATMLRSMPCFGFGFSELGTVTIQPQTKNKFPRIFKYPKYRSIQNALGFPNIGFINFKKNLISKQYNYSKIPYGINIGINRSAPLTNIMDYIYLIKNLKHLTSYFVINLSSPNTKKLATLQNTTFITELFQGIADWVEGYQNIPVLLKLSPDITIDKTIELCGSGIEYGMKGIVLTNTTTDYSLIPNIQMKRGGLSGTVLTNRSYEMCKAVGDVFKDKTTIISVGGITTAEEAFKRFKAGAKLVQILTGFIYNGFNICRDINTGLIDLIKAEGCTHISELH